MPAAQLKPCPSEPVAKSTKFSRYRTKAEHLTNIWGRRYFKNSMLRNDYAFIINKLSWIIGTSPNTNKNGSVNLWI